jgi:hypothetical protein
VIEAQGLAEKRNLEGFTYQQERGFDVAEKVAQNEGTGNFSSAGIGLGMIAGIGGTVGGAVSGVISNAIDPLKQTPLANTSSPAAPFCDNCGNALSAGAAFCDSCGAAANQQEACAKCGYVFEKPGKFCPKCGTKRGA